MGKKDSFFDGKKPNASWSKYYREKDMNFKIPDLGFYDYFMEKTEKFENLYCLDYYGNRIKYNELVKLIDLCADGFYNLGIRKGDVITVCLPNMVEAIVSFFAASKIGAVTDFIHPLSSENELRDALSLTDSKLLILLNTNYIKWKNIENEFKNLNVIYTDVCYYMPFYIKTIAKMKSDIDIPFVTNEKCIIWNKFIFESKKVKDSFVFDKSNVLDDSVILHSGGTTGIPKGVVLSNKNLIAYIESDIILSPNLYPGDCMLAIMPIFHGFGLVSNILFSLCMGMFAVIRPRFDVNEYYQMVKKFKPQALSGVPTLFESVFDKLGKTDIKLDFLKYIVAGGDELKLSQREKINKILLEHGSKAVITVGYGLTEAVCAVVIESSFIDLKENTVGIPFPGVYVGIFNDDLKEVRAGVAGEICICGPTVMSRYYKNSEETNLVLRAHKDGNIWLHTGDLGSMDEDGYLTYLSRIKRMIISSGYNVYPSRIENLISKHPAVLSCAVVGVPHKRKIEVPKVYVVLNEGYIKSDELLLEFKNICVKNLPKYAWPVFYEIVDELPVTKLGKIDYKVLQNKGRGE